MAWAIYHLHSNPETLQTLRAELNETDEKYPAIQAIIDKHWED